MWNVLFATCIHNRETYHATDTLSWFLYTGIVIPSAYLSQPFHIQMNELNEWKMSKNGLQKWILTLVPKSLHKGISFLFIVETVPFQIYQQFLIFWPLWSSNNTGSE